MPFSRSAVAQGDRVDPAGAPRPAGGGADLAAALAQLLAHLVVELGREGAGADPGRVGLGDAPDLVEVAGPDARADRRRAGDRVRRGDEGIGAVVEVEHRPLGPLEQDGRVAVERVPAELRGVGDVGLEAVAVGHVGLGHRVEVEGGVLDERAQHLLLGLHRGHDLLAQDLLVEQVLDPDAEARGLVGVAGADPAPGRADLELAELDLAGRVEQHVVGHDQVGVGRDAQPAHVDAALAQPLDLVGQHARVDHDPVADRAGLARVEDPRGDQVELEGLAVADDRVAGVVAALEADDHVRPLREQVGDLSLPFIAPLGADYDQSGHERGIMAVSGPRMPPRRPVGASGRRARSSSAPGPSASAGRRRRPGPARTSRPGARRPARRSPARARPRSCSW